MLPSMKPTAWKTIVSFWLSAYFQGRFVSFREIYLSLFRISTNHWGIGIQSYSQIMIGVLNHLRNAQYSGSTTILRRSLDPYCWCLKSGGHRLRSIKPSKKKWDKLPTSTGYIARFLPSNSRQLMLNGWFGLVVWDSRGTPNNPFIFGIPGIQTTGPQTTN